MEHFGRRGRGLRLREGMVFTVEPMINEGGREIRMLGDGWTVVTADGTLSAQYEHTVVVTAEGCEILTPLASLRVRGRGVRMSGFGVMAPARGVPGDGRGWKVRIRAGRRL